MKRRPPRRASVASSQLQVALKKLVCLGRPVRLRLASLRFAKESSASRAKEPLHAGKNRCALKSGEPADRFEEQSSVMSPRLLTRPTIRSIEKARCRDVRYAHEKAREKPVTAEVRRNAAFGGTQCRQRSCRDAGLGISRQFVRPASRGGKYSSVNGFWPSQRTALSKKRIFWPTKSEPAFASQRLAALSATGDYGMLIPDSPR